MSAWGYSSKRTLSNAHNIIRGDDIVVDDAEVEDDLTVGGDVDVTGSFTAGSVTISGTSIDVNTINEKTPANGVTITHKSTHSAGIIDSTLTASKLVATDGSKQLITYTDFSSDILGGTNVTSSGTYPLTLNNDVDTDQPTDLGTGDSPTFVDVNITSPTAGTVIVGDTFETTKAPTGFCDVTAQTVAFNDVSRLYELSPTAVSFDVYVHGVKYTKSVTDNITLTATDGIHIVYYDSSCVLQESVNPTDSQTETIMVDYLLVSALIYDGTNAIWHTGDNSLHGTKIDKSTAYYLHKVNGLALTTGGALNTITTDQDGSLDTHAQFGLDLGEARNEDRKITAAAVLSTTGLPCYYKTGASGAWRRSIVAGFSVINFSGGSGRLAYNQYTGGSWQQTEVSNNDFVLCHVFMTVDSTYKYIALQGQNLYTNSSDARAGALVELRSMTLDAPYPLKDSVPLGTVIFKTSNGHTNTVKARIQSTDSGDDYVDFRQNQVGGSMAIISEHADLGSLDSDDHLQYVTLLNRGIGETLDIDDIIVTGLTASMPVFTDGSKQLTNTVPAIIDYGSNILKIDHITESTSGDGVDIENVVHIEDDTIFIGDTENSIVTMKLNVKGVEHGGSSTGANWCFYSDEDDYPMYSSLNYSHDNISHVYDGYHSGGWKSSSNSCCFRMAKDANRFYISSNNAAVTQGNAVTWTTNMEISPITSNAKFYGDLAVSGDLDTTNGDITITNSGSATLTIEADSNNSGNEVPELILYADGQNDYLKLGVDSDGAQISSGSYDTTDAGYINYSGIALAIAKAGTAEIMHSSSRTHFNFDKSGNGEIVVDSATGSDAIYTMRENAIVIARMYSDGTDNSLNLECNATKGLQIDTSGIVSLPQCYGHDINGETVRDLMINSAGELGYDSGSLRIMKTNINDMPDTSWIYDLDIKSYNYRERIGHGYKPESFSKTKYCKRTDYGSMVEDTVKIIPDICFFDTLSDGSRTPRGILWKKAVPALIKVVQDQKNEINMLSVIMKKQKLDITNLKNTIKKILKVVNIKDTPW